MIDETIKGVKVEQYLDYIIDSEKFIDNLNQYQGTSLKSANDLLNKCLNENEQTCLFELVNSKSGWYYKVNGRGSKKLKLTGSVLELTHRIVVADPEDKDIEEIISNASPKDIEVLKSVYLKQKLITFKNLKNNKLYTMILYRGVKNVDKHKPYKSFSLESWSSSLEIAKRFSGINGLILRKEFSFQDIFAYNKSIFKYGQSSDQILSRRIKQEYEFIVEFTDDNCLIDLQNGNNLIIP